MSAASALRQGHVLARARAARSGGHYEDQAGEVLRICSRRLDVHRRSVLLFYLVFGLIAGFVLGIAGAKGVLAATPPADVEISWVNEIKPPHAQERPKRYASLLWHSASPANAVAQRQLETAGADITATADRSILIGLLCMILTIAGALAGTFWWHLSSAYASPRKTELGWPPRD